MNLLKVITVITFLISLPFILVLKMNICVMIYFLFMNYSISVCIALILGIEQISRVDNSVSPRYSVEKGTSISSFIPWMCQVLSIVIYMMLSKLLSSLWIMIVGCCVLAFVSLENSKLLDRLSYLIIKKADTINYKINKKD